jgi:thiamine-phosphate pyrophosphorylase
MNLRTQARRHVRGLYPLLDDGTLALGAMPDAASTLAACGISVMQLRLKRSNDAERLQVQRNVLAALASWDGLLVIDDRADLALIAHRESRGPVIGLHLGQNDLLPSLARQIVGPDVIIGLSTHHLEQVAAATAEPAVDYLGFGPVFATRTKDRPDPVVGLDGLAAACRATDLPVTAIGGIDLAVLVSVRAAGAAAVAVVQALFPDGDMHDLANRAARATEALK